MEPLSKPRHLERSPEDLGIAAFIIFWRLRLDSSTTLGMTIRIFFLILPPPHKTADGCAHYTRRENEWKKQ